MVSEIAKSIPEQQVLGLKRLRVLNYRDENELEQWPVHMFANKAENCEELVLCDFWPSTRVQSRNLWLVLAGKIC